MNDIDCKILISRIEKLATERGLNLTTVFVESGVGKNFKSNLKTANPSLGKITLIANYLNTTVEYLTGKTDIKEKPSKETGVKANAVFLNDEKICMIPVFESVSAGFGTQANDCIIEYMPCYIPNPAEINDYMCIKVTGDSMFPKIENGDIIQVHRQTSVDSGSIAVVLIDGEDGVVKRVEYGNDWIELHSINPMYPVRRFEGADVLRLRVVGLVKKIIKDV